MPLLTKPSLNVIAIGGEHHYYHFIPVACELHRRGRIDVRIFVPDTDSAQNLTELVARLGFEPPPVIVMRLPGLMERCLPRAIDKITRLFAWNRQLRDATGLYTAERTSTLLRRLPGRQPLYIHTPHGAGDRAKGFEKRIALFDHVLVSGPKDRDRMIADGLIAPDRCQVMGSVKVASLMGASPGRTPLFDNDRPVVLYNPHFDPVLGSYRHVAERLMTAMAAQDRYNFIFAPHVRLSRSWSAAEREHWESRAVRGKIIVDAGSPRCSDMTYTLAADLYIGDVSSQIYEYLVDPRPALFIDTQGKSWRDDPSFAMWHLGRVVTPDADLMAAIDESLADNAPFAARQTQAVQQALGIDPGQPGECRAQVARRVLERGAALIETILVEANPGATDAADATLGISRPPAA